jgi:hypothetical protein
LAKRGPGTVEGKAAFSRNAIKHGLRSDAPVIPELEDFDEWDRFREGIIASYAPEGAHEADLAEEIASLRWRKKRAVRYETEMTAHFLDDIPDDLAIAADYAAAKLKIPARESITMDKIDKLVSTRLLPSKDVMEMVMRYEAHLHRMYIQTHHELETIQARRKGERVSSLTRIDVAASPL